MKLLKLKKILLITFFTLSVAHPALAEVIDVTLLQLNDVYEITPVAGGTSGGLARIATLKQELLRENPHTYAILAGDLLSPSALGTAKVNGEAIAGAQIVDVMNLAGLDYATFGNHEFDLTKEQFYQRLAESKFTWFSSNVFDEKGQTLPNVPQTVILPITGKDGKKIKIGLIGVTLHSNPPSYITYGDPLEIMQQEVDKIKDQTDVIIAVTHLALAEDQQLAEQIPEIDLILGGHEHENIQQWRGNDLTPIFKADANGRTVYLHHLSYDTDTKKLKIESELKPITADIPEDPQVTALVNQWLQKGFEAFRRSGFEPSAVVATTTESLDGLERSVRNYRTSLTQLIAQGMLTVTPSAQLAMFNSGSIRIDDVLPPSQITQYDIIRIMPFGGKILLVEMKGSLLEKVLNQGLANKGTGGFLQTANVTFRQNSSDWLIKDQPLNPEETYQVAINNFLLTGKETGLDYLTLDHPDVKLITEGDDIRFALIQQLQNYPQ
jgi:5'-nucleotidase / UDP-sugar diphosphatase